MSKLEFALSLIIVLITFLAFALTLATILLGSDKTKMAAVELFRSFVRGTAARSAKPQDASDNSKSSPVAVNQIDEEKA
jgi:hypothetical protein